MMQNGQDTAKTELSLEEIRNAKKKAAYIDDCAKEIKKLCGSLAISISVAFAVAVVSKTGNFNRLSGQLKDYFYAFLWTAVIAILYFGLSLIREKRTMDCVVLSDVNDIEEYINRIDRTGHILFLTGTVFTVLALCVYSGYGNNMAFRVLILISFVFESKIFSVLIKPDTQRRIS